MTIDATDTAGARDGRAAGARVVIERSSRGALRWSVSTSADTLDGAPEAARVALELHDDLAERLDPGGPPSSRRLA